MGIKTKYNIGDKVFFIQENAVHQGFIKEIAVYVSNDGYSDIQREYYDIKSYEKAIDKEYKKVNQSLIYKTKEELLNSL